jgi:site-specific DNA-methyltransferase (adenine-specific)
MLRTVERGKRESEVWEKGSGFKNEENHLTGVPEAGRWPSNLIHDGSEEVLAGFPPDASVSRPPRTIVRGTRDPENIYGGQTNAKGTCGLDRNDSGSAARFFYCAKATRADREEGLSELAEQLFGMGNAAAAARGEEYHSQNSGMNNTKVRRNVHPAVKPTSLMRYLVRLVTPPGGLVFDPFMGSGSTAKAAALEGCRFIGSDDNPRYYPIACARAAWAAQQGHLFAEAAL